MIRREGCWSRNSSVCERGKEVEYFTGRDWGLMKPQSGQFLEVYMGRRGEKLSLDMKL